MHIPWSVGALEQLDCRFANGECGLLTLHRISDFPLMFLNPKSEIGDPNYNYSNAPPSPREVGSSTFFGWISGLAFRTKLSLLFELTQAK
jgi:hypothetical protein